MCIDTCTSFYLYIGLCTYIHTCSQLILCWLLILQSLQPTTSPGPGHDSHSVNPGNDNSPSNVGIICEVCKYVFMQLVYIYLYCYMHEHQHLDFLWIYSRLRPSKIQMSTCTAEKSVWLRLKTRSTNSRANLKELRVRLLELYNVIYISQLLVCIYFCQRQAIQIYSCHKYTSHVPFLCTHIVNLLTLVPEILH